MECKLSIDSINPQQKANSRRDVVEIETVRLSGYDEANGVEWSLTLKAKGEIPEEYKAVIGHQVNDSVIASIGPSAQQSELEA